MSSKGYNKSRGRGFSVTADRDGGRSFYEHDERGSGRIPEGHWRGNSRGSGRSRGAPHGGRGSYRGDRYRGESYRGGKDNYYGDQMSGGKWKGGSSRHHGARGTRGNGPRSGGAQGGRERVGGSSSATPNSRLEDEDVVMEEHGHKGPSSRFNPYNFSRNNNRGNSQYKRIDGRSNYKRGGSRGGRSGSKGADLTWVEIRIPFGKKVEKSWLLSSIQTLCDVPFVPVDYHVSGEAAVFYVDDHSVGEAIRSVSRRITSPSGRKVVIITKPCVEPAGASLNTHKLETLKRGMSNRYDPSTMLLDLSDIYNDKDLQKESLFVELQKKIYMESVMQIISENIPEIRTLNASNCRLYSLESFATLAKKLPNIKVLDLTLNRIKHVKELEKIKGLKLEELRIDGNPLCSYFKEKADYVSAVRQIFPKVTKLDGMILPPPIAFDVETTTELPPVKNNFFVNDHIKNLLVPFVEKFFAVYDSGNRQGLFEAYHEEAMFSLSIPQNSNRANRINLASYHKENRNLLRFKESVYRFKTLKHSRVSVTAFLKDLPATHHDMQSFILDVSLAQGTLLFFTVHGVFKEIESRNTNPQIVAFSRSFLSMFVDSRLMILNDQLCLRCPTENQIKAAFPSAAPTPSHSPVLQSTSNIANPPQEESSQQKMIERFSKESGMNLDFSKKCLEENNWNYQNAGQVFSSLKASGKIPKEAFQ